MNRGFVVQSALAMLMAMMACLARSTIPATRMPRYRSDQYVSWTCNAQSILIRNQVGMTKESFRELYEDT